MRKYILILMALIPAAGLFAQSQGTSRINREKVSFFTKKVGLTDDEAKVFWPIYNDYTSRKQKLVSDKNSLLKYLNQNWKNLPDDELEKSLDEFIGYSTRESELTTEYYRKFREILPVSKVIRIYSAEMQFRTILLNQLQQRPDNRLLQQRRIQSKPGRRNNQLQ